MMPLSYTVSKSDPRINPDQDTWRLEIEVTNAPEDLSRAIFVYHVLVPGTDWQERCEKVADLEDLSLYGESPVMTGDHFDPYYRKPVLVLDFSDATTLDQYTAEIELEILDLWNEYTASKTDRVYSVTLGG